MVSSALRCKVPLRRVFEDVFELVCLIRCDTSSMLAVLRSVPSMITMP